MESNRDNKTPYNDWGTIICKQVFADFIDYAFSDGGKLNQKYHMHKIAKKVKQKERLLYHIDYRKRGT